MDDIREQTEEERILAKAALECSADAVRRTFAAGLPIAIVRGNLVLKVWSDGREEQIGTLDDSTARASGEDVRG